MGASLSLVLFLLRAALFLYRSLNEADRKRAMREAVVEELLEEFHAKLDAARDAADDSRKHSDAGGLREDDGHRRD